MPKVAAQKRQGFSLKGNSVGRKDVFYIPPDMLFEEEGFNARLEYTGIPEFAQYIKVNGVDDLPPLNVYKKRIDGNDERLYISKGHRRIRAIRMAIAEHGCAIRGVPVMYDDGNEEQRTIGMVTENSQVPLTMLERGLIFQRMIGYKWTQEMIAEKIGKSQPYVHKALVLAKLPKKVQDLLTSGVIADSTAYEVATTEGVDEGDIYDILVKSINEANAGGAGKRGVGAAVKNNLGKTTPAKQAKVLADWLDENELVLKENPRFAVVKVVYDFITAKDGNANLDELNKLIK